MARSGRPSILPGLAIGHWTFSSLGNERGREDEDRGEAQSLDGRREFTSDPRSKSRLLGYPLSMRYLLPCLGIGLGCLSLAAQAIPSPQGKSKPPAARQPAAKTAAKAAPKAKTPVERKGRRAEYLERLARLPRHDAGESLTLATWCKRNGLFPEMRASLAPILDIDPDHPEARALLGQLKVGRHWMPKAKAYKAMGYSYDKGVWRSPAEMRSLHRLTARQRHMTKVAAQLSKLARGLVDQNQKRSEKARDAFQALARKEKLPQLGYEAEKAWQRARFFWKEHRSSSSADRVRGMIEMRAQMTRLLGFGTHSISLGTGSPVNIQLPRTRSVVIGTTVPFGR
jgi:hypothetical protein